LIGFILAGSRDFLGTDIKSAFAKAYGTSSSNPAPRRDVFAGQGEQEDPQEQDGVQIEDSVRVQYFILIFGILIVLLNTA
jgi:hypothetical protein